MMGTKRNPGAYDCYAAAEPDEPIFVLLARDPAAPSAIDDWADIRSRMIRHGLRPEGDWPMVAEARMLAHTMREWRAKNRPMFPPTARDTPSPLTQAEFDQKIRIVIQALIPSTLDLPDGVLDRTIAAWRDDPNPHTGIGKAFAIVCALFADRIQAIESGGAAMIAGIDP